MPSTGSPTSSRIVVILIVEQVTVFAVAYLLHATVTDYDVTLEALYKKDALLAPLGASGALLALCKGSGFIFVLGVLLFQIVPAIWIKLKKNNVQNNLQIFILCSIMQLALSIGLLTIVLSSIVFSHHGY